LPGGGSAARGGRGAPQSALRVAIRAAHSVDEAKDIRDKAAALEAYARQANDMELERQVHDIRVRAERRAGEISAQLPKAQGHRSDITSPAPRAKSDVLEKAGISSQPAFEWEKLAEVPEEEFEAEVLSGLSDLERSLAQAVASISMGE
jgi:hypothetical protein